MERTRVHHRLRHRARGHPRDQERRRAVSEHLGRRHPHPPLDVGIFGLLGIGYVWTYRWGIGNHPPQTRWGSRATAAAYGVASALTLDEFALWLDLKDDYWDQQGRKSIDAVAIFAGLLTMGFAGRSALNELGLVPKALERFV